MSRIAIVSGFSCALSWWLRLQDEGHEVMVWNVEKENKRVGENLVPLAGTFDEVFAFAKVGMFKGEPTIALFDSSGDGDKADQMRQWGIPVICGGSFCDKLEKDREFGMRIAADAGCQIPLYEEYASLSEAMRNPPDGPVYFKSDRYLESDATKSIQDGDHLREYFENLRHQYGDNIKHILQQKIDGVALSTARWWNGMSWVGPYESSYEHKAFMDGDVGPSTGCSFNASFFHRNEPPIARALGWERLSLSFRKHNAPPGLYDINALVDKEGDAYFLEWTPRLGYDSELASFRLFKDLGAFLFAVALGRNVPEPSYDIAYNIRLSVPPYPWEHGKKGQKGTAEDRQVTTVDSLWSKQFVGAQLRWDDQRGLMVASPEGLVGVVLSVGDKLSKLHESNVEFAKNLHKRGVTGLQFRTDGDKCIKEDAQKVKDAGHDIHPGLVK